MLEWTLKEIDLPLKFEWSIARGKTRHKRNFIVTVSDEGLSGEGEVAWNSRFDESEQDIRQSFDRFCQASSSLVGGVEGLIHLFEEIEVPNCLKFGLESAYTHFLSKISNRPIQELLGVNTVRAVETDFSVPIMGLDKLENFIISHNLSRFSALKVKLSGRAYDLKALKKITSVYKKRLYLDANEAFKKAKDFLIFAEKLLNYPIEFIEQPFSASCHDQYIELKKHSPFPIFADESLLGGSVTDYFAERFDGVNIKLMKSGSYFGAIRQMREAREKNLRVQLGCMVESTLGISSALAIASKVDYIDLDGFLFLKKDPFKLVHEENGKLFFSDMQ